MLGGFLGHSLTEPCIVGSDSHIATVSGQASGQVKTVLGMGA